MSQFNLDLSYNFKGVKARSQSIKDSIEHANNYNMTFADDLAGDVFNALYQHNPTLKAADNSQYSQAIRAALASPQFQHLRMQTRDSVHWSSTAAALITSKLAEKLSWQKEEQPPQPPQEECEEPSQSEEENEDETQSGNEEGEEEESGDEGEPLGEQSSDEFDENSEDSDDSGDSDSEKENEDDNGDSGGSESDSEPNDGSEEQDKDDSEGQGPGNQESSENEDSGESDSDNGEDESDSEDSDNESDGSDGDNESDEEQELDESEPLGPPSHEIEQAISEAAKEMDQLMGGIRAGTQESLLGSKEGAALAELYTALGNNEQLSKLIQMIGRMQINQHFLNGISYAQTETPVSITMGKDIRNVLPQDLGLLLGNNEEFQVFAAKYRNSELLQKEMRAETNAGKGPMIVCLDESGSMMGDKNTWAQSLTIAMYLQCIKERRQFALVKFASNAQLWPLPANNVRMDIEFMKSVLTQGYLGGGTSFGNAWLTATNFIRKNPTWKQADIVFVTDGMGGFNKQTIEVDKADLSIRLISFFIDPDNALGRTLEYSTLPKQFIELNEAFTHIQDLSERGERQAFELIRQKDAKGYFEVKAGKLKQVGA